jgi:membrane protein implicated in regulation of membrane protease activity
MDYFLFRDRLKASVLEIRDRGRRLAELNIELAKAEMQRVAGLYGAAAGMLAAAGLLVLYGLGFLFATVCIALDIVLPLWAAALIVTVLLFLTAATLALVARNRIKTAQSSPPKQAAAEAKTTAAAIQDGAKQVAQRAKDAARGKSGAAASPAPPVAAAPQPIRPAPGPTPAAPAGEGTAAQKTTDTGGE